METFFPTPVFFDPTGHEWARGLGITQTASRTWRLRKVSRWIKRNLPPSLFSSSLLFFLYVLRRRWMPGKETCLLQGRGSVYGKWPAGPYSSQNFYVVWCIKGKFELKNQVFRGFSFFVGCWSVSFYFYTFISFELFRVKLSWCMLFFLDVHVSKFLLVTACCPANFELIRRCIIVP